MKKVRAHCDLWGQRRQTMAALLGLIAGLVAVRADAQDRAPPRFFSLKMDRVVVRAGPSAEQSVKWVFQRAGLPVEGLRESNGWWEIRDAEGASGWVSVRQLSQRRTVVVVRESGGQGIALKARAQPTADTLLVVEPGIVANLVGCDGTWCQVSLAETRGYLAQTQLWGVRPNEVVN